MTLQSDESDERRVRYRGDGFDLVLDPSEVAATATGAADGPVDLTWLRIMTQVLEAVTAPQAINYVSATLGHAGEG